MSKFTEYTSINNQTATFICDFSPPKGVDFSELQKALSLHADFISVAYNPGKSVRIDSLECAYWIKQNSISDVIFSVSSRDMNKLAIQSHLLGAQLLGLENLVIFQGDIFNPRELLNVKPVMDYKATELIHAATMMNNKLDYIGTTLTNPTNFCIGSTLDLNKDLNNEIHLVNKKIESGAEYFLLQPIFSIEILHQFLETYNQIFQTTLDTPLCLGVQILNPLTKSFGHIPIKIRRELELGKSPVSIAYEFIEKAILNKFNCIYLLPAILPTGDRDYDAASTIIKSFK